MKGFVDTHCHLFFEDFNEDREAVKERAQSLGVSLLVNVGTTIEDSQQCLEYARSFDWMYAAAGIHPHYAHTVTPETYQQLKQLLQQDRVVALGEVGLDFFRDHSPRRAQEEVFGQMLQLSKEMDLPIIIHCRDAHQRLLEMLNEQKGAPYKGVFHCFSGDLEFMKRGVDMGFYISFAAPVTYKKNDQLRKCAQMVPSDRYVLETDCPFLPPQSKRGKRNEPSYLVETAQTVAEARSIPLDQAASETTRNAKILFGIV